ncbi:MAG: hypothetical protein K2P93_08460 [Alphaproteobacteria bacterium]|nr:hypothetical protein [Alphaproteobacteria bacterium]
MKILILKKVCVFSLTIGLLINSIIPTNADFLSSIDSLNGEEVKIILRALNNKCQVNWERDFRLNTPHRKERSRRVLEFLNVVYTERQLRLDQEQLDYLATFYKEREITLDHETLPEVPPDPGKVFRAERWKKKKTKLEMGRGKLEGLLSNSERVDFLTFAYLSPKPIVTEAAEDFVILDSIDDEFTFREITFDEPVVALDLFPSDPATSSSSLIPVPSSSIPASVSAPALSVLSDETIDEAEVLLLMLDEKSAKITLNARLNDFCIPFDAFHFSILEETEKCTNVVNYLNLILERKLGKVLDKQTKSLPDSPSQQFYLEKYMQYQVIHDNMWGLFTQKMQSPPSPPIARASRNRTGSVKFITRQNKTK